MHSAHQLQRILFGIVCTTVAVSCTPPLLYSAAIANRADQAHCISIAHRDIMPVTLTVIDSYCQLLAVSDTVKVTVMCLNCQCQHLLAAVRQTH
jgi:hypothetical protein